MGVRSRCRKALLQGRFASELSGEPLHRSMDTVRSMLEDADSGLGAPLSNEDWAWVLELGRTVALERNSIDERISAVLENYSLERLSVLTRLIMEQAVAEMFHMDPPTPVPVAIDEAIDLASEFDTDEAGGLVNGVLDRLAR